MELDLFDPGRFLTFPPLPVPEPGHVVGREIIRPRASTALESQQLNRHLLLPLCSGAHHTCDDLGQNMGGKIPHTHPQAPRKFRAVRPFSEWLRRMTNGAHGSSVGLTVFGPVWPVKEVALRGRCPPVVLMKRTLMSRTLWVSHG